MRRISGVRLERRPSLPARMQLRGAGLSAATAVALFAGYALLLGRGAAWLDGSTLHGLTATQRASEIDTMRGYLIQVGVGVLAAGALLYTALNFQLAREGHVTDRYTKAIEQLGSERLDVRLGAIYALERIMIDSARDHPTIVEVLAAFTREHASAAVPVPDLGNGSEQPQRHQPLATDVQAAVTVLGRRPARRTERGPVNLARAVLAHADLTGAYLAHANLARADLVGAYLAHANLTRANLVGADLTRADLFGANLTGADLTGANLTGVNLYSVNLFGAILTGANLTGANLTDEQRNALRGLL
jgi:hypothetical protein